VKAVIWHTRRWERSSTDRHPDDLLDKGEGLSRQMIEAVSESTTNCSRNSWKASAFERGNQGRIRKATIALKIFPVIAIGI